MRRSKLYPLVALVASALGPLHAHAQLRDTQWVRPAMMLLVDTSGSMERKPDTSSCVDCLPSCTNNSTDERNRWAITLEALTGSFPTFRCTKRDRSTYSGQYDQNYFLPHYEFTTQAPGFTTPSLQTQDGLLDSYKTRLKFGLMTFDGVSTTVTGATLVPWDTYPSVKTDILGQAGQYSYPDATAIPNSLGNTPTDAFGWKPLSFPGCLDYYGVNAGARGKGNVPGSLISVGTADDQTAVATVNDNIQSSLLQVRPYAGTPIAAMLDDLRYYLRSDPDINSTDPYYQCRDRFAVLLTDGAPDAMFRGGSFKCDSTANATCAASPVDGVKACQCPYDTEVSLAGKLISQDKLKKLWVVAFNVNDTAALAALDNIALAAGTNAAARSSNLAQLRTNLDTIFKESEPESTSRSVPVVLNTGRALMLPGGKQFIISSGFKVSPTSDTPWEGRLWRQRIECDTSSEPAEQTLLKSKGDIFHESLNDMNGSSRTIYTVKPTAANAKGTVLNQTATTVITVSKTNELTPSGATFGALSETNTPNASQALVESVGTSTPATFDGTISPSYFDGTTATRDNINSFVRGLSGTYRAAHKLGDIYHSNPAVIPPVFPGSDLLSSYDPQLRSFYQNLIDTTKTGGYWGHYGAKGRPGAVFVATNDGLLHAFNLDDWTNKAGVEIKGGTEFWAMMPPAVFDMMPAVVSPSHQFVFDGTPVVKDMILSRNSSSGTLSSVLLVALRGLPAYMALDVTWPEQPKFLWQRSFGQLGATVGTPQLANVRVRWGTDEQVRAVAILPGGEGSTTGTSCAVNTYSRGKAPNPGARDNVRCWGLRGRWLYVVDVETGELIQEFDGRHFPSAVTGSVAVDGEGLSVTRAAYFTDADGVLYRLSMVNSDPRKWRVVPIWDIYGGTATSFDGTAVSTVSPDWKMGRTATFPPVLTRDPKTGNLTIVVGTGDVDNLTDTTANRVISINEVREYDSTGEIYGSTIPIFNWKLQLDAGESVTGPMAALNDTLYFTSFTGPGNTSDKCAMGTSRIVSAQLRARDSKDLPVAGINPGTGTAVLSYRPTGATGTSLLLGLSIARDPVCYAGTPTTDPVNPGSVPATAPKGGTFKVRALVAGDGGEAIKGSGTADPNDGQKAFTSSLPVTTQARSVGWSSSVE
jgi:type IV pilus assembly protein PilY1